MAIKKFFVMDFIALFMRFREMIKIWECSIILIYWFKGSFILLFKLGVPVGGKILCGE